MIHDPTKTLLSLRKLQDFRGYLPETENEECQILYYTTVVYTYTSECIILHSSKHKTEYFPFLPFNSVLEVYFI